jgi:hypothetical protein
MHSDGFLFVTFLFFGLLFIESAASWVIFLMSGGIEWDGIDCRFLFKGRRFSHLHFAGGQDRHLSVDDKLEMHKAQRA